MEEYKGFIIRGWSGRIVEVKQDEEKKQRLRKEDIVVLTRLGKGIFGWFSRCYQVSTSLISESQKKKWNYSIFSSEKQKESFFKLDNRFKKKEGK